MKATKTIFGIILFLQIWVSGAKSQGIKFVTGLSWERIKEKAKNENKYIFLDMYTTWCGPCKMMDRDVYSAKEVGDFYNQTFISVKVQMDSTKSDNQNTIGWYQTAQELGKLYGITVYPSYVFLNPAGQLVGKHTGLVSADVFNSFGGDAMDPGKQYALLLDSYNNGKRDPDFVRNLIRLANAIGQRAIARKIASDYINQLTENEMLDLENIWCIYENTSSSLDRGFSFFRDHALEIEKSEPKMKVVFSKGKVMEIIKNEQIAPYIKVLNGKPDWKRIDSALAKFGKLGEEALALAKPNLIIMSEIIPYSKSLNGKPDWKKIHENLKPFGSAGAKALELKEGELIFDSEIVPFLSSEPSWIEIQKKINKYDPATLRANLYSRAAYYYVNAFNQNLISKSKPFISVLTYYFKIDSNVPADFINNVAWSAFEKFKNKEDLKAALGWSKLALDKDSTSAGVNDTYANLWYRIGDKNEALKWSEKALAIDPFNPEIISSNKKMKQGIPTWPIDK